MKKEKETVYYNNSFFIKFRRMKDVSNDRVAVIILYSMLCER